VGEGADTEGWGRKPYAFRRCPVPQDEEELEAEEMKKLCNVKLGKEGDEFVALIEHVVPPIGDKRKDVPDKELRNKDHESLMTEMKKYLEDCYDDE
jgi:hypothetical protein